MKSIFNEKEKKCVMIDTWTSKKRQNNDGIFQANMKSLTVQMACICLLKNMVRTRSLFVYFRPFLIPTTNTVPISTIYVEISVCGLLGIRTWGRRMESTQTKQYFPLKAFSEFWTLFS